MIRCTPVWGPGRSCSWVSGLPSGSWTSNDIVVGVPAAIVPAGREVRRA